MILAMAGYDYITSSLEERERLALTKTEIKEMLSSVSGRPDVEGCVYISTCGRGELYLYCEGSVDVSGVLAENLRKHLRKNAGALSPEITDMPAGSFRKRIGRDAVDHLFHLACGMRSQIYGEDQILSQIRQSLEMAREAQAVSGVPDRLFLSAIAAAKKVKSEVRLTAVPASVADRMLALLESRLQIRGRNCLVIGNGEIGRLCAAKLLEAGAKVTVTVRNFRTREVLIPVGCRIVDYRERFRVIPATDVIVSATASPHFTLPYFTGEACERESLSDGKDIPWGETACGPLTGGGTGGSHENLTGGEKCAPRGNPLFDGRERFLFDLALPRDIAPEYGNVPGIHLFGLDEVSVGEPAGQRKANTDADGTTRQTETVNADEEEPAGQRETDARAKENPGDRRFFDTASAAANARAEEILAAEEQAFFRWLELRGANRQAVHVGELAAEDVTRRADKRVRKAIEREIIPRPEPGAENEDFPGSSDASDADRKLQPEKKALQIEAIYADAVKKVVDNLLYDLRGRLPEEQYKTVVEAMEQSALVRTAAGGGPAAEKGVSAREHGWNGSDFSGARDEAKNQDTSEVCEIAKSLKFPNSEVGGTSCDYFPLFLDTRKKTVLIYGAGQVALRRVRKLLDFACGVRVIAPEAEEALLSLAGQHPQRIRYEKRSFSAEELVSLLRGQSKRTDRRTDITEDEWKDNKTDITEGERADNKADVTEDEWKGNKTDITKDEEVTTILFVVAATDDRGVNREIGAVCRACGVPVSVADRQEESSCYFPGLALGKADQGGARIVAGISSEGADHRRTAETVRKVSELLGGENRGVIYSDQKKG